MVVQHNLKAMNSNRMLGVTQKSLATSTEKLSSGYQINRAADNAAGLSISEKMRKQIRGLDQASSNAQDGISSVQTAEGALQEVTDMLQRMNELAVQAANGTNATTDRTYIQNEVDQLVSEIDRVAETSKFNETYLLKGDSTAATKKVYTANYSVTYAKNTGTNTAVKNTIKYTGTTNVYMVAATLASATSSSNPATATKVGNGDDITKFLKAGTVDMSTGKVTGGAVNGTSYIAFQNTTLETSKLQVSSTSGAITATSGTGAAYILDTATNEIKKLAEGEDLSEYISIDGTNTASAQMKDRYRILAQADGATAATSLGKAIDASAKISTNTMLGIQEQQKLYDADGNEVSGIKLNQYYNDNGNFTGGLYTDSQATKSATASISQFVKTSTTEVAGDLSFTLHVGADSADTNKITTSISSMSAAGLGINKLASTSVGIVDASGQNATDAIDVIAEALQKVSTQRSALGAVQNRLEHTIKNLDNIAENTTSAESAIRDTDMATEMVKYSNSNILSQAGQSMLAQANQGNQGVLSLLG